MKILLIHKPHHTCSESSLDTANRTGTTAPPRPALLDRGEQVGDDFGAGLGAEVALAVDADADVAGFEVAVAEDEHGVDFHRLGAGDLGFDRVGAGVEFGAYAVGA